MSFAAWCERGRLACSGALASPALLLVAQGLAVFTLFVALQPWVFQAAQLDFRSYFQPILITQAISRTHFLALFGGPTLLAGVLFRRLRWRDVDATGRTRILVLAASGLLAWVFSVYDYNLYYDQAHGWDRALVLALWLVVAVHPAAFPAFLGQLMMVASQLHYPLPMASWLWPDKRLVIDLLVLFLSFLLVKAVLGRRVGASLFPFVTLCLVGATYANAGVSKLRLGPGPSAWLGNDSLANLFVSSYLNGGWLSFLTKEQIVEIAGWIQLVALPLAAGTLLIELSGLGLLLHRRLARVLLLGFISMHLGILVTSGIFFWKWIVVDLVLIWLLTPWRVDVGADPTAGSARTPGAVEYPAHCFGPGVAAASVVIMLALPRVLGFVAFAWFDTRVANFFVYEGVAENGDRYPIHPRFFAPYDLLLQQARFYYLLPTPVLVGTFGTTDSFGLMKDLEEASPMEFVELQRRYGKIWFNPRATQAFGSFVFRYGRNAMLHGEPPLGTLDILRPPYHFQSQARLGTYRYQEPLASIEVIFETYWYTGNDIVLLDRRLALTVPLSDGATDPSP